MLGEISIDWCVKLAQQGPASSSRGVTLKMLIENEGINSLVRGDETPPATRFKEQNQNFQ